MMFIKLGFSEFPGTFNVCEFTTSTSDDTNQFETVESKPLLNLLALTDWSQYMIYVILLHKVY